MQPPRSTTYLGVCSPRWRRTEHPKSQVCLPWEAPRTFRILPSQALASKVLCKRHNQALSPLDAEAGRLLETIGSYDRAFNEVNPSTGISIFCGEELEKWMLKITCGMVAGGQAARYGISLEADVRRDWVSILSGEEDWPPLWGL